MATKNEWWRGAVIYQVYPRSYCDANADGIGDLRGIISKLHYIKSLGVDAIWISPFMKSPMKDFGYDVSDYRDVDPTFGDMNDFIELIKVAHELGIKVLIDQVWAHSSDQHNWFKESRMNKTNEKADWYIWADPKPDGTPPNNWLSYFGGAAWTWDSRREQYYLHHFLKEQPALNLRNPELLKEIKSIAAFWLDLGVDGFRLDVAHAYLCDAQLRDNPPRGNMPWPADVPRSNPFARQQRIYSMCVDEILDWAEDLRAFVNQWPDRCLLAEAGGDDAEAIAATYVQTGKRYHLAYSFGLVGSTMKKHDIVRAVRRVEELINDGWLCWSTGNHDVARVVSRINPHYPQQEDVSLFAMALGLSLRGSFCMFQGEELGLPQVDLAFEDIVDPYDIMLYPEHIGRDGGRTPFPWMKTAQHAGFSNSPNKTWLPVGQTHTALAADTQEENPDSVLNKYRAFIAWRKNTETIRTGDIEILETDEGILAYKRTQDDNEILCVFNPTEEPQSWTIPEAGQYDAITDVGHHYELDAATLKLAPYGYIFLNRRAG